VLSFGGFNWTVLLLVAALFVALRFLRAGMFVWAVAWWCAIWIAVQYGFATPVPGSVVRLYMGIATLAIVAYVSSSAERWRDTTRPIVRLIVEPRLRLALLVVLVLVPGLVAFNVWRSLTVQVEAPSFGRTVHPAPPSEITVHDEPVNLITADQPYDAAHLSPEQHAAHLANGRRVYYQNCFFCHGDGMAGDGMYAYGLNPLPTNFTDVGVLPNLQSSFVFWRIAKGGPGLPEEGGPWDTAMPAWERFLTIEEIWDVNLFLYEFNGLRPRALHQIEGH
jgi:mono/diheme cytochrome c family protein